ncbi:hypothetical protein AN477_06905 [Alicyclobacillus ferrooxydans]|uniref:RNA polymerase sigma-70 domain-containing protein n=2 Tax=Alicyclobacillus ferrooxydans TaxID=471514 RepID=A0A0N8PPH7_9BACL|nr:hypothetical protein AN477_06905 [Alicyclobacillus ferrooxydans]
MEREFPRIYIPSDLPVDQKKVLVFLLIYEAGYYETQSHTHDRRRIQYQLRTCFPNLMSSPQEMLEMDDFIQILSCTPVEVAAKAYRHFVGVARSIGLWDILKPYECQVLKEIQAYAHKKTITETDWLQVLFDLKINTQAEREYYQSLIEEKGYQIQESIPDFESVVEEYSEEVGILEPSEVTKLFYELADEAISLERKSQIKNTLFIANQRLVPFVLEKMRSFANYTPARDREDDLQEGLSALWLALEKFDVTKGNQFSTYAVQCIRGNILRFRNKNRFLQHVPENKNLNYQKAIKLKNKQEAELGREITLQEWAKLMGMPEYKLMKIVDIHKETVYFGSPVHASSEDLLLEEVLADPADVEDEVMQISLSEELTDLLGRLDQREEDIIRLRYGFFRTKDELLHAKMKLGRDVHPNEPVTLEEIAKVYGITRERVRQILDNACHTLRHPSISMNLLHYREEIDERA